jgi:uncharacterized protein (DUF433 family)
VFGVEAIAAHKWSISAAQIADEYDLSKEQVTEALRFYAVNKEQVDFAIASEQELEAIHG